MKTNIKFITIKGIDTPSFEEPKGEAFEKAMKEIHLKVEAKRNLKSESEAARAKLRNEISSVNNALMMADEEEEMLILKARKKKIQDELSELVDYSGFNVNAYAKKLINEPEIQKIKQAADEELTGILTKVKAYDEAMRALFNEMKESVGSFTNSTGSASGSSTRRTNVKYNSYNDSL